jgi:hypothetical protein
VLFYKLSKQTAFLLGFIFLAANMPARADYYYHPYYQRQQASPIISLTLDPQEVLNGDLRVAAREDRTQRIEILLKKGANVNGVSEEGESALMYASEDCNIHAGRLLLSHSALAGLRNHEGKTALMYAAMAACSPMVSLLVRRPGASIHLRDKSGRSALDYAREGAELYMQGPPVESLRLLEWFSKRSMKHLNHIAVNDKILK